MMKTLLMTVLIVLVSACGFEPVYKNSGEGWTGNSTVVKANLDAIAIDMIPNREGVTLRNHLIDNFYVGGYPSNPEYTLQVAPIEERILQLGIDRDDDATRAQLSQTAVFRLIRIADDEVVLQRTARATTGYNILTGQYTTFVTAEDARKQALQQLADNITTDLELYFSR